MKNHSDISIKVPMGLMQQSHWNKIEKGYKHQCRKTIAALYGTLYNVYVGITSKKNSRKKKENKKGTNVKYFYNQLKKKHNWKQIINTLYEHSNQFKGIVQFSGNQNGFAHNLYLALVAYTVKAPARLSNKFDNLYLLLNSVIRMEASLSNPMSLNEAIEFLKKKQKLREYLDCVYNYMVQIHWLGSKKPIDIMNILCPSLFAETPSEESYFRNTENYQFNYKSLFDNYYLSARYHIFTDSDSVSSLREFIAKLYKFKIIITRNDKASLRSGYCIIL